MAYHCRMKIPRLRHRDVFFIELVVFLALWLIDDYIATLLTVILVFILTAILLTSLLVELIERSKVPRRYFTLMSLSIVALLAAAGLYLLIMGGAPLWLRD